MEYCTTRLLEFPLCFSGFDFSVTQTSLTFPTGAANGTEMCLNISIIDDDRVEYNETFFVYLIPDNPLDTINGNNSAFVFATIVDNDGIYALCCIQLKCSMYYHGGLILHFRK